MQRHGLSIGIERVQEQFFLTFKAIGTLTHQDYLTITPMIDSALAEVSHPRVRALVDCTELEGWELRAAWDDFKLGLKYGSEFEKVAIVGNKQWQSIMAAIGGWFISGEVQYFEEIEHALSWLYAK